MKFLLLVKPITGFSSRAGSAGFSFSLRLLSLAALHVAGGSMQHLETHTHVGRAVPLVSASADKLWKEHVVNIICILLIARCGLPRFCWLGDGQQASQSDTSSCMLSNAGRRLNWPLDPATA